MDAKTRRVMKAKQGKVETGSGSPGGAEGYEGQVQVRDTKDGPMLFAKLKGKWIQSPLLAGGDFFVPKAWSIEGVTPSGIGTIASIPNFIQIENIIAITFIIDWLVGSIVYKTILGWNDFAGSEFRPVIKLDDRTITTGVLHSTLRGKKVKITILYR